MFKWNHAFSYGFCFWIIIKPMHIYIILKEKLMDVKYFGNGGVKKWNR